MQTNFDIAICGAGPVGQTLALLLIRRGIKKSGIVLIDAKTDREVSQDRRTIALSSGSRQILETAGAWPVKATAIRQIHISRAGHFGRSLIDAAVETLRDHGYAGASARIVADRAGVNQGLIFYHFGSVADLLLAKMAKLDPTLVLPGSVALPQVPAPQPLPLAPAPAA